MTTETPVEPTAPAADQPEPEALAVNDWQARGHFTVDLGSAIRIVIPRSGDPTFDAAEIRGAIRTVLAATGMQPEQVELVRDRMRQDITGQPTHLVQQGTGESARPVQLPARPQTGARRAAGRRQNRPELTEGVCPNCNGVVGIVRQTGQMPGDKLVCMGGCKDDRGYNLTIRWFTDD